MREKRKKFIKFRNIKNNNTPKSSRVRFEDGWKKIQDIKSNRKRLKHNTKKDL